MASGHAVPGADLIAPGHVDDCPLYACVSNAFSGVCGTVHDSAIRKGCLDMCHVHIKFGESAAGSYTTIHSSARG